MAEQGELRVGKKPRLSCVCRADGKGKRDKPWEHVWSRSAHRRLVVLGRQLAKFEGAKL